MSTWFEEIDEVNNKGLMFKVSEKLFSKKSPFQQVDVYKTLSHGNLLVHDGKVMVTERDEFIYHDMITHVALFTHPNPKNVLIIGGGDGGTAREVLRHKTVEKCTMVEIDPVVIEACQTHFPGTSCEFKNSKLNLLTQDGVEFINNTTERFDVILIDSSDPIGPAKPLFDVPFYKDIFDKLTEDGIVVSQAESIYYDQEMQTQLLKIKSQVFPKVFLYNYNNLSYPSGTWNFSMATKGYHPIKDFNKQAYDNCNLDFKFYNLNVHKAAFALPQFVQEAYKDYLQPIEF